MGSVVRHTGMFTVEDRIASAWHYLPVEVPAGTSALWVTLTYARESGAVLDLGCFGPGGPDGPGGSGGPGGAGGADGGGVFRGWSGGARSSFVVSELGATPGYLPGPVTAGLWQVVIGLYAVPADGVRYEVTAETLPVGGSALVEALAANGVAAAGGVGSGPRDMPGGRPARRSLPARTGFTWLAGDLHAHTEHSDGVMSVPELAEFAIERGLDFVAVTDHNTVSHHALLPDVSSRYRVTLLPGQEVTTAGGHAGVLGDIGWVDFRTPASSWLAATEANGGLMSINHPFGGAHSWLHPMPKRPPLLEVWHWSWLDLTWTTPLSWWQAWDPAAIPVGGSDWHRPGSDAPLGTPTTWVLAASPAVPDILDGLRAGRVAISERRDGPVLLREEGSPGSPGSLVAVGAEGLVVADGSGPFWRVRSDLETVPGRRGYQRLLTPAGATVALCP